MASARRNRQPDRDFGKGRSSGSKDTGVEKVDLVVEVKDPNDRHSAGGVSVFVTVDTSGQMTGPVIDQATKSLQSVIDQAPSHARFTIRTFAEDAKVLVSKKKRYLDVSRALSNIRIMKKTRAALYDAIGETIKHIPYETLKTDDVYIIVYTSGHDTGSVTESLESAIEEIEKIVPKKRVVGFYFVTDTRDEIADELAHLGTKSRTKKCQVVDMEEATSELKQIFEKSKDSGTMHLKLELVGSAGLGTALKGLTITASSKPTETRRHAPKPEGAAGTTRVPARARSNSSLGETIGVGLRNVASKLGWSSNAASGPSRLGEGLSGGNRLGAAGIFDELRPGKIHVANIPVAVTMPELVNFFSRWGPCSLFTNGGGLGGQWAIITYASEDCAARAYAAASRNLAIRGQFLVVNQYE